MIRTLVKLGGRAVLTNRPTYGVQSSVIVGANLAKLTNRDFSLFLSTTATIDSVRAIGLTELVEAISLRSPLLTHRDLFRIMTGLARMDVVLNPQLMNVLVSSCTDRAAQFMAHEISTVVVEVAACHRRVGVADSGTRDSIHRLLSILTDEFGRKIDAASPMDLANVVVGLSDVGVVDPELYREVAEVATVQIAQFRGPELCDLLLGFASLGVHCGELLDVAFPQLTVKMHRLHTHQLLQLAFVVARAAVNGIRLSDPFVTRFCSELESRQLTDISHEWNDFAVSVTKCGLLERLPRTKAAMMAYFKKLGRLDTDIPGLARALVEMGLVIGRDMPFPMVTGDESVEILIEWLECVVSTVNGADIVRMDTDMAFSSDLLQSLSSRPPGTLTDNQVDSLASLIVRLPPQAVDRHMDSMDALLDTHSLPVQYARLVLFRESSSSDVIHAACPVPAVQDPRQTAIDAFNSRGCADLVTDDSSSALSLRVAELVSIVQETALMSPECRFHPNARIGPFPVDLAVVTPSRRIAFVFLSDSDVFTFDDGSRCICPETALRLEGVKLVGFECVTIDCIDWRRSNTHQKRIALVRNSLL